MTRLLLTHLLRGMLHEICGSGYYRTPDLPVKSNFRHADGVNDHPGAVRAVLNREFQVKISRYFAKKFEIYLQVAYLVIIKAVDAAVGPCIHIRVIRYL